MSDKPNRELGIGCVFLFALPFAAIGVWMSVLTVRSLLYWNQTQHWAETPCTIVEADLEVNHDSDGATYQAIARYSYQWEGKPYECDTVSIHGGSDNVGSFHEEKAAELEGA